jgi:hypothetical protein
MKWLRRIFKRHQASIQKSSEMKISPQHAKNMLMMIANTREQELSCDEVHGLLDQYAEMALRGENPAEFLPLVHYHLDMCPDCREEYEALVRMLEGSNEFE